MLDDIIKYQFRFLLREILTQYGIHIGPYIIFPDAQIIFRKSIFFIQLDLNKNKNFIGDIYKNYIMEYK